jgi:ribonuclease P protein component
VTGTGAFGRDRRVRKRRDFQRVQSIGRRVVTAHFVLLLAAQPAGDAPGPARLGLVVSRKVGNAVARNRVKRVCRASFRLLPDLLPAGVDLVVIARDGAETLGLREVRAEWTGVSRLLRRRAQEALAQTDGKTHLSPR